LSSANSAQALEMLPHLPLYPVQEQEVQTVQQGSKERDIVSEIQISEGTLAKCHPSRATVLSSNQSKDKDKLSNYHPVSKLSLVSKLIFF